MADLTKIALEKAAWEVVRRVTEYDDRTSPEDWPEALLITGEELHRELLWFADDLAALPSPPPAGKMPDDDRQHDAGQTLYRAGYYDGFMDGYLIGTEQENYPDTEGEREIYLLIDSENVADGWMNNRDEFLRTMLGEGASGALDAEGLLLAYEKALAAATHASPARMGFEAVQDRLASARRALLTALGASEAR